MKRFFTVLPALALMAAAAFAAPRRQAAAPASYWDALSAYEALDLDRAESILSRLKPSDKPVDGTTEADLAADLRRRVSLARDMMGRVEKVQILDTLRVDPENFFRVFRLSPAAGSLQGADAIPAGVRPQGEYISTEAPVHVSENGDCMIFPVNDYNNPEEDNTSMFEISRLADGSWTPPEKMFSRGEIFGDGVDGYMYSPFLMPDGVTLFFAATGPQSIGGLDIFEARRDGDSFLQPANKGMPYNSPFNDYMMAVDEQTGIGWWVSDRNDSEESDEPELTVYIFAPQDLRVNYPADMENLPALALLSEFTIAADAAERLSALDMTASAGRPTREFTLALPDGRILTSMRQLGSAEARRAMGEYLDALATEAAMRDHLAAMRADYAAGNRSLSSDILAAESQLEQMKGTLTTLRNDVVRAETGR